MPNHRKSKAVWLVIHPVSTGFKERVLTANAGFFLQRPERAGPFRAGVTTTNKITTLAIFSLVFSQIDYMLGFQMVTTGKSIALGLLIAASAVPGAVAQQRVVRGDLPSDAFVIDPSKLSSWSDKQFTTAEASFATKQFEARDLEEWNHEFPARHATLAEKTVDVESVDLPDWESGKVQPADVEKRVKTEEVDLASKSKWSGPIVANEKWARSARKSEDGKKSDELSADFIVQATIRPLGVPELQEKLNEYSSPPGERQKPLPSKLQKSSKF